MHRPPTSPCTVPVELAGRPDHGPRQLRRRPRLPAGTAPIFDVEPRRRPDRDCSGLTVPTLNIPITHPGRRPHRHRLRAPLHRLRHHPADTAGRADLTIWGFPESTRTRRAIPEGAPGNPPAARDWPSANCNPQCTPAIPNSLSSTTRPPARGSPWPPSPDGRDLPGPRSADADSSPIRRPRAATTDPSSRSCSGDPTTKETDSPSGLDFDAQRATVPRRRRLPSCVKTA